MKTPHPHHIPFAIFAILIISFTACNNRQYSVEWMKDNFEKNDSIFYEVTNLFNGSIPDSIKKDSYITLSVNKADDCVEITLTDKIVTDGAIGTKTVCSSKEDPVEYKHILHTLTLTDSTVDSIQKMLNQIKCTTIRTVDYKYYDVELYNTQNLKNSYLHLKPDQTSEDIIPITTSSEYGRQFSIETTKIL